MSGTANTATTTEAADDIRKAAQAVLDARAALSRSWDRQPREFDEQDLPVDREGWLAWDDGHQTVYAGWQASLDRLEQVLGRTVSRHPMNVVPLCEQLLA